MAGATDMTDVTAPIVVLHDFGDELGGAPWRDALGSAGWDGPVIAPDLPGHRGAPAPAGGHYEVADALLAVVPLLATLDPALPPPVVLGCGVNGWAAHVFGLAGRACAVVAVDGLGGPWRTAHERVAMWRDSLRALAADPAAMALPVPVAPEGTAIDPRLRYGFEPHGSRRLAERGAAALPVPALLVESAASPLPPAEVDALAALYRSGATVRRVTAATAEAVAAVIAPWVKQSVSMTATSSGSIAG